MPAIDQAAIIESLRSNRMRPLSPAYLDQPDAQIDEIGAGRANRRIVAYEIRQMQAIPVEEVFNCV